MIAFEVIGLPKAKGSMRAIHHRQSGKIVMVNNKDKEGIDRNREWELIVRDAATQAMGDLSPFEGGVLVRLAFTFPRPKTVTVKKRPLHTVTPDLDKLARACLDAMSLVVYKDDAQVMSVYCTKAYDDNGARPGVSIKAREHPPLQVRMPVSTLPLEL